MDAEYPVVDSVQLYGVGVACEDGFAGVSQHRGTGIPVMIQALRAADMSPPRFEDGISTFRVTFLRHSLVDSQALSWLSEFG